MPNRIRRTLTAVALTASLAGGISETADAAITKPDPYRRTPEVLVQPTLKPGATIATARTSRAHGRPTRCVTVRQQHGRACQRLYKRHGAKRGRDGFYPKPTGGLAEMSPYRK